MKIVFVCTGNSCRSVIAHYLLKKMAQDKGFTDWEIQSCGVAAEPHFPTPEGVLAALKERGIENINHTPQLAGRELLTWADAVLTMTREHRDYLLDQYPEFTDKTFQFMEYATGESANVADPLGQAMPVYLSCRDIIEKALASLLEKHAPTST